MTADWEETPVLRRLPVKLSDRGRRKLLLTVIAAHLLTILGPAVYTRIEMWLHPAESRFKVKLAGALSTGPEVGPQQRTPPAPPAAAQSAPAAPQQPQVPKVPPAQPQVTQAKPVPKTPVQPKVSKAKPVPKTPVQPKVSKAKPAPQPAPAKPQPAKPAPANAKQQPKPKKDPNAGVYQGGGSNFNPAVPAGLHNYAQTLGKQNNASPGGGQDGEDPKYWDNLDKFFQLKCPTLSRAFMSDPPPETEISITVEADGRVSAKRISQSSGNKHWDDKVQTMLNGLTAVPAPKHGKYTIKIGLKAISE